MRDELDELREAIMSGDYSQAFAIIDELDEMSRSDKINKIHGYMGMLLLHLIKQAAEQRLTKSWRRSINFSLRRIARTNKRDKAGGYYLDADGLAEELADAWTDAIEQAAIEAFEGVYEADELARMVSRRRSWPTPWSASGKRRVKSPMWRLTVRAQLVMVSYSQRA